MKPAYPSEFCYKMVIIENCLNITVFVSQEQIKINTKWFLILYKLINLCGIPRLSILIIIFVYLLNHLKKVASKNQVFKMSRGVSPYFYFPNMYYTANAHTQK